MAWITQIRVAQSKTVFEASGNAKAEREFTISIEPGQLRADDEKGIVELVRDMAKLIQMTIQDGLKPSDVRSVSHGSRAVDEEWPREITCKLCGKTQEVRRSTTGRPYVICCGHFLEPDGSPGRAAGTQPGAR